MFGKIIYDLELTETQPHWYEVRSPQFPDYFGEVTGSYVEEAKDRANSLLNAWAARQKENGRSIPDPGSGKFIIHQGGANSFERDVWWTKKEVQRVLKVSTSTIDRYVAKGILKKYKVCRRTLFRPLEVQSAIKHHNSILGSPS